MMRTVPFRLDIHTFPYQRQFYFKRSSQTLATLYPNLAAVLLQDSVADGQTQSRTLAHSLGREERIVDFLDVFAGYSGAGVLDEDLDLRIDSLRSDPQLTAFSHGIAGIDEQIQENLLKL